VVLHFDTRTTVVGIDSEGAKFFSEALGKLTALQQLNLDSTILIFFVFCGGLCCGERSETCAVLRFIPYSHLS
jgi:hypothetical protein